MSAFGFDPEEIFKRRPRVVKPGGGGTHSKRRRIFWITLVVLLGVVLLAGQLTGLFVNYLFFSSVGHTNVFWTPFVTQVILFLLGFVLTGGVVAISIPGWRAAARTLDERGAKWGLWGGIAIAVLAGVIGGAGLASQWQQFLLFLHQHSFNATDPVFGKDYSFFIFTLPVADALQAIGWAGVITAIVGAGGLAILCAAVINAPTEVPIPFRPPEGLSPRDGLRIAVRHVGIALVGLFIMAALGAHYGVYHLATSQHDNFWGLDATQRNVIRPILGALQYIALGFGVLTAGLVWRFWRRTTPTFSGSVFTGILVVWLVIAGVLQGVPALVYQATTVNPNALQAQSGPITDFLKTSRYAWNLQDSGSGATVESRNFQNPTVVTLNDLTADPGTLVNTRIQDTRELQDAIAQADRSRSYQTYQTVTVDRYPSAPGSSSSETEVMVAPREISSDNLPSTNFVNQSLIYTHGYGVTGVSVNQVDSSGKPYLLVGQQPMTQLSSQAPPDLSFNGNAAADPRIYCGLATSHAVVTNTTQNEFDYPSANGDQTSHAGYVNGIWVNNFFVKAALSFNVFGGTDLLLTNTITPNSQVLMHRTIADRISTIAPFLTVDGNPYIVVDPQSNHLMYVADAYVKTSLFPELYQLSDGTSYMRNSVKAVVDAKTCQTTLYMVDPTEPMAAAYNDIYPGLMTPIAQMPDYLQAHLRYPEDLFQNQATVYAAIHVDPNNPSVFFNNSDRWRLAQEVIDNQTQDTQAYYAELTLPGDSKPSFVLLQTFSPASGGNGGQANNMTSWLAAQSNYGPANNFKPTLVSVRLGNNVNVLGPFQFDQNINTDPTISKQLSLLNQGGSKVFLGNVIVLPFGNHSFLYVRPLYVEATSGGGSTYPKLTYVIVGNQNSVSMAPTFAQALQGLFNTTSPIPGLTTPTSSTPTPSPSPGSSPTPSAAATPTPNVNFPPAAIAILQDLLQQQQNYQHDVAAQNYTAAGKDQDAIKNDVAQLEQILGTNGFVTPTP